MVNFLETVGDVVVLPESFILRLWYALKVSGTGILKVFFVLVLLMLAINIMHKVYVLASKKEDKTQKSEAPAPAAPVAPPVAEPVAVVAQDDTQVAAVIAAAVAVYMEAESPKTKYRIRSFRRV